MSETRVPEVSVVIPTGGDGLLLCEQLGALAAQGDEMGFEVVVVANRSRLDLEVLQREWGSRLDLVVVRADERAGAGYARNRGVERARGSVLLFVDDDDVVAPGYVAAMCRALVEAPAVAARIDVERLNEDWQRDVRPSSQDSGLARTHGVAVAGGGTLGVRRSVFDEVGPFAEAFDGLAAEDTEWCLRLAARGHQLAFAPDAVMHCRIRVGVRAIWGQAVRSGCGEELVSPAWDGWRGWLRSLAGPVRLMIFGRSRGMRRRGLFLLGRRVGRAQQRCTGARRVNGRSGR